MTSVASEVKARETSEVASRFLMDDWLSQAGVDIVDPVSVVVRSNVVLLCHTVAPLLTIALIAAKLVVKAELGGLAVFLLLAVGLLVAEGLLPEMVIAVLVGPVKTVVRFLAVARVSAKGMAVNVMSVSMVAVMSSMTVDILARTMTVLGIMTITLLLSIVITSIEGFFVTETFFASVTLLLQIFIGGSIALVTSITFIMTVTLFFAIASNSAKGMAE